jgi:hypothetical protein
MKEGGSARGASFWVLSKKKKSSFLCFSDWFCFVVRDVCIIVLDRL